MARPAENADRAVNGNRWPTSIPNLGGASDSKNLSQCNILYRVVDSGLRVPEGCSASIVEERQRMPAFFVSFFAGVAVEKQEDLISRGQSTFDLTIVALELLGLGQGSLK